MARTAAAVRSSSASSSRSGLARIADLVIRVAVAAGLAVDAYIHADLAKEYSYYPKGGALLNFGQMFLIEAGVASFAALLILAVGRRIGYSVAFLVIASALGGILLYRYVNVGRLGPLPNMYDPTWFHEKLVAVYVEAATAVVLLVATPWTFLRGRLGH